MSERCDHCKYAFLPADARWHFTPDEFGLTGTGRITVCAACRDTPEIYGSCNACDNLLAVVGPEEPVGCPDHPGGDLGEWWVEQEANRRWTANTH